MSTKFAHLAAQYHVRKINDFTIEEKIIPNI